MNVPLRAVPRTRVGLVATLILTLAAAPLGAQTTLGLRGGLSTATWSGDERGLHGREGGSRSGVVSGIDLGIPLGGMLDLRLGLGLAQKGGGTDPPPSITAGRSFLAATAELDYLQLSTLLRAGTETNRGLLDLGILAGPYVAFNYSCEVVMRATHPPGGSGFRHMRIPPDVSASCSEADGTGVSSTDFGLALGAAFEVTLHDSVALALDVIYGFGLTDIDDDGTRNRRLAIQSGFVFAIG